MTLLVEVGVDNPTVGFEITDVNAVLKLDTAPALLLTADQLRQKIAQTLQVEESRITVVQSSEAEGT